MVMTSEFFYEHRLVPIWGKLVWLCLSAIKWNLVINQADISPILAIASQQQMEPGEGRDYDDDDSYYSDNDDDNVYKQR